MRKPPTGEPCAGEPHARFGGRGGRASFPTPIIVYCYAKHLDFDPSDPAYELDSGVRRNDGVSIDASTFEVTLLNVL